jgi:hypothetical protein
VAQRTLRQHHRYDHLLRSVQLCVLLWRSRLPKPKPPLLPAAPKPSGSSRPSATHPWRRRLLAKK